METGNVLSVVSNQSQDKGVVFTASEIKQLADFYALLIKIDKRKDINEKKADNMWGKSQKLHNNDVPSKSVWKDETCLENKKAQ